MNIMKLLISDDLEDAYKELTARRAVMALDQTYLNIVRVVEDVKSNGDRALKRYSLEFDGLEAQELSLGAERLHELARHADEEFVEAVQMAFNRIKSFNEKILALLGRRASYRVQGAEIDIRFEPIKRVGIYVPRGRSTYVSTLIMAALTARLSGVEQIEVCTPPVGTTCSPNFAYVCEALDVNDVYLVGGAHAIAALAYGTETVKRVDKIVGPGGPYVTMAKHYVSKDVAIDFLAGPTELLMIADESADEKVVALDMLSQAEHGPDSWVGLVTDSEEFGRAVVREMRSLEGGGNDDERNLSERCWVVVVSGIEKAAKLVERLAPEHVKLIGGRAEALAGSMMKAGVLLVGENIPASATDYFLGPNHILPTLGVAASRGGLSPLDFLKLRVEVRSDGALPDDLLRFMLTFAQGEGFEYHARSIANRMRG